MSRGESSIRDEVEEALTTHNGVLPLEPAWVARSVVPAGCRLRLPEHAYDVGERGWITERWLASTTLADNRVGPPDEGLSYLALNEGARVTLRDAIAAAGSLIMGAAYAAEHRSLGRLAKILDYGERIPFHIHPRAEHAALVGRRPKEESYYFLPGVDAGPHPETFFGVHPSVADKPNHELLLPYLVDWDSDLILRHSRAYLLVADEGFHVPAGVLHAPGTALTFELQEDSDTASIFQAMVGEKLLPKEMLFKDVRPRDRQRFGERFLLEWVDWPLNGEAAFYEHRHLDPLLVESTMQPGGEEYWIFYNSSKYSGKKLVVRPGMSYSSVEPGVYSAFVWQGAGTIAGREVRAADSSCDEILISHDVATQPHAVTNTGTEDLFVIKFFGPGIHRDVPFVVPSAERSKSPLPDSNRKPPPSGEGVTDAVQTGNAGPRSKGCRADPSRL